MRRVVVTGMGIVSPIGNSKAEVLQSLRTCRSGIVFVPEMKEWGFKCQVAGLVRGFDATRISKRPLQTMPEVARYAAAAALEAIRDAELPPASLRSHRVGVVLGTEAGGIGEITKVESALRVRKPSRLGATGAVKLMGATAALNLATWLGIQGRCYSLTSACATGTDAIGHAFELIRSGLLDLCLCGGAEERSWRLGWGFCDNLGMSSAFNTQPDKACRPYDRDRQGMVVAEGAGVLALEDMEQAKSRGAHIYAEVIGYGSANNGADIFEPNGDGLSRCLEAALRMATDHGHIQVDYVNPHGVGSKVGDAIEVQVIREVLGPSAPFVSSTKGLNGHSMSAAGAHEAIFTLLMLRHDFVAPTVNLDHIAPECEGIRHVRSVLQTPMETAMSFNAGLGGTNACLIFKKL